MAVELMMGYRASSTSREILPAEMEDAASAGLKSVEELIRLLSNRHQQMERDDEGFMNESSSSGRRRAESSDLDYRAVADVAVDKFKKMISLLDRSRTGHARFRRAPVAQQASQNTSNFAAETIFRLDKVEEKQSTGARVATTSQRLPPLPQSHLHSHQTQHKTVQRPTAVSTKSGSKDPIATISFSAASSFMSGLSGETDSVQPSLSMSSGFQFTNMSQSSGKPPLSTSSLKRKCSSMNDSARCGGSSARCHCSKKRKLRVKRVVRIPAVSLKTAEIPADDFSWRKYGQKPIKGSPHPRGYYKCSSVRGCPARKHVERAVDDATQLIVTYEGEHSHALSSVRESAAAAAALVVESSR